VQALKIKYFDTVPVAASLSILKSGFLFVAAEMGNQLGFQTSFIFFSPFLPSWGSASLSNLSPMISLSLLAISISSKNWGMTTKKPSSPRPITLSLERMGSRFRRRFSSRGR
jgi:hypothetical protein